MSDLGFMLLLALWSTGAGLWLLRRFGPLPDHPADTLAPGVAARPGGAWSRFAWARALGRLDAGGIENVLTVGGILARGRCFAI